MSNLNRHPVRRAAVGVLAGTLAFTGGAIAAGATPANAVEGFEFDRLAGADRYATAADIATSTFATADTVVLASGEERNFPDALTGNYLAGDVQGPILLTRTADLPDATADALEALAAENVIIVGGTSAVSAAVEAELEAAGYNVTRLGGIDRYATAEQVAMAVGEDADSTTVGEDPAGARTAILGNGQNFPDILAAGPIAYAENFPITITRPNDLPQSTEDVLRDLGIERVIIVGGETAVSSAVEAEVDAIVGEVDRLSGQTRFDTAVALADFAYDELGFDDTHINLATGEKFADALAGGPHGGEERAPIVLTFTNSLQPATEAFLEERSTTLTDGHIFGGPAAVSLAVEAAAEEAAEGDTPATEETDVTVTSANVEAGQPVTGTITGEAIDAVTVAGDCVQSGTVTDNDTAAEGIQFSIPTNNDAQAGACELTFTVSYSDDREDETFTETVNVQRPASATTRPELTAASVLGTVEPGQATPSNPAGTTVRYTFDETVTAPAVGAAAAGFHAYDTNRNEVGGVGTIVAKNGNTVDVRYTAIDTAAESAALTVATVDFGAVTDLQGQGSPEGDAALGTTSGGGTTTLPAGITDAPDLVSVGNFRQAANAGQTAVDFTFDQAATVLNPNGFQLVLLNNDNGVAGDNEVTCAGPAVGSTNASGGTIAGGNGTTTITVICTNPDAQDDDTTPGSATDPNITAADVARGTVLPSTVESGAATTTAPAGVDNVLQAAAVSNSGNTDEPDLVSVELRPGATAAANDAALFTFDEPIDVADGTKFCLYDFDGNVECGAAAGSAVINTQNRTQVLVTFTTATADDAVGGNVTDGAVVTADDASTALVNEADANEQDEEGVANTATGTGQTSGRTAGPDLTAVTVSRGPSDAFGNPGAYRAVYTFDEDVTVTTVGDFKLYAANGTVYTATTCAVTAPGTGQVADDVDNTVTCTAFGAATSDQIGAATLGTVDDGAVTEETGAGLTNVEGAEFTTGGTGTRAA